MYWSVILPQVYGTPTLKKVHGLLFFGGYGDFDRRQALGTVQGPY